jgi:hypothetical protein
MGLELNENGDLIDTKTGKSLNDFGATRFDVAVRWVRRRETLRACAPHITSAHKI